MSKIYGPKSDYAPIRREPSRTAVCYDMQLEQDGVHATWHEVYFYTKRDGIPDTPRIKAAVIADINERTRLRIVSTLSWNGKPVWLSTENQFDWKAAYDRALQAEGTNLPLKIKIGEDGSGDPVYHTFNTVSAFGDFWNTCLQHIHRCLADGYAMKDGMDWSLYAALPDEEP